MAEAAILSVAGLTASYRSGETRIPAVRGVSFDLYRGETLALVGESGCGKTSVALAVLGLLPGNATVESGEVRYAGEPLLDGDAERLRSLRGSQLSIIFQDAQSALTPTVRIGEQMAEVFAAHGNLSHEQAHALGIEALARFLPDPAAVVQAFPMQLSGGMAQRLMIAMATALKPTVLIADEPTSSLDPAVRQETLSFLEGIRDDQGVAVLLITHDFGVVARLADHVAVMYAGELVETSDVATLFRAPRHPYTFGLLSSLPGTSRERTRLIPLRGQPPELATLPPHCPFLPRCNKAISRCRIEATPALDEFAEGHRVACYNPIGIALHD